MNTSVEKTGKTVNEAVESALNELGISREEAEIEVEEEGSKAVLGIFGGKEAKVKVTAKKNIKREAEEFLKMIFDNMKIEANLVTEETEDTVKIDISGEDIGILIGRRGETLDSMQYLTNLVVNKEKDNYKRVILDIENYRAKREDVLKSLAQKMADKVLRYRKNITLDPMNPYERRIIHAYLQNVDGVETTSIGEEPNRKVVIKYKRD